VFKENARDLHRGRGVFKGPLNVRIRQPSAIGRPIGFTVAGVSFFMLEITSLSDLREILYEIGSGGSDVTVDTLYFENVRVTFSCIKPSPLEKRWGDVVIEKNVKMSLVTLCEFFYEEIPLVLNAMFREERLKPIPCLHDWDRISDMLRESEESDDPSGLWEGGIVVDSYAAIPDAICEEILIPLTTNRAVPAFAWCRNGVFRTVVMSPVENSHWLRAVCEFNVCA